MHGHLAVLRGDGGHQARLPNHLELHPERVAAQLNRHPVVVVTKRAQAVLHAEVVAVANQLATGQDRKPNFGNTERCFHQLPILIKTHFRPSFAIGLP
jgi:hypothetical protein